MRVAIFTLVFIGVLIHSYGQSPSFKIATPISTIDTSNKFDKNKVILPLSSYYRTKELIESNKLMDLVSKRQMEIVILEDELEKNEYDRDSFKIKSGKIQDLKKEIITVNNQVDSLYHVYIKDYLALKRSFFFNFGSRRSQAFFDIVSGNSGKSFRALGNAGFNLGDKSASLYSEIISGSLSAFRVSLGATIAKSAGEDSTVVKEEEAYQRLVSTGGNTVLNIEYPLIYLHSSNARYNFISTANMKGTADIPAFGTQTTEWAGSGSLGLNFYGEASTSKNELSFFANINLNYFSGTKTFKENLGIKSTNFFFGQLSAGIVFLNNFKISFVIVALSSEKSLRNKGVIAGGQVLK